MTSGTNNSGGNSSCVVIGVALIAAIATIVAAWIGPQVVVNINQQGQSTAVAQLQPTIDSLNNAPTQTPYIETITQIVMSTQVVEVTRVVEVEVTKLVEVTPVPPPQPTALLNTSADAILEQGQVWKSNGVEMTLVSVFFDTGVAKLNWRIRNNTDQNLAFKYDINNFTARDNLKNQLKLQSWGPGNFWKNDTNLILKPGEIINNGWQNTPLVIAFDTSNCQIKEITVSAANISRIEQAQWKIPVTLC